MKIKAVPALLYFFDCSSKILYPNFFHSEFLTNYHLLLFTKFSLSFQMVHQTYGFFNF